ncbi:MAG: HAD family hydrolase [Candidatus Rokuibacteriota bacterium]
MPPRALILDYGDVLTGPQRHECVDAMAARLRVGAEAFQAAYWEHRRPYDAGQPAAEYWRRVLATLGRDATRLDVIEWLIGMDVASWTDYREPVWELAREFKARGGRTGFLSNGIPEVAARLRAERGLDTAFDAVIVSSEVGLTKPDPRIFRLCLDRLRVEAGEALFVDDRAENVEAAAGVGLRVLHFVGLDAVDRLTAVVLDLLAGGATGRLTRDGPTPKVRAAFDDEPAGPTGD